jgi:hypothetical protein
MSPEKQDATVRALKLRLDKYAEFIDSSPA